LKINLFTRTNLGVDNVSQTNSIKWRMHT